MFLLSSLLMNFYGCKTDTSNDPFHFFEGRKFTIRRGTNISHLLSQSLRRGPERENYFVKDDMDFISASGFDHVRIPIDEEQMWDSAGDKEAEAFSLLHNSILWAAQNKLRVIVDLHILRSHYFNAKVKPLWTEPAAQEWFFQCWRDLSGELSKYPVAMVAYELMNEPVADDPDEWNVVFSKALAIVRETEPQRKIVIGSNMWQSAHTFKFLKIPADDKNIILSFHFYSPHLLTHYKATWTPMKDYEGPVYYPGLIVKDEDLIDLPGELLQIIKSQQGIYNRDTLEQMMREPIEVAASLGLPLYCGEWGCLPTIADSSRYQWYKDMKHILEKNKISWANWDYKGGFGIINGSVDSPYHELINILTGD
jgi:endoglucanase